MSVAASNLISLLRLLSNDLPADAAIRLRLRLTNDMQFADQYRRLARAAQATATPEELLDHIDETDPLDVARFIEGTFSADELALFEQRCWQSESLLREVVSAWNATRNTSLLEPSADSEERARSLVARLLSTSPAPVASDSAELSPGPDTVDAPAATSGDTARVSAPADAPRTESDGSRLPYLLVDPEPTVLKRSRRDSGMVLVVATVVLAVVTAVFWYWQPETQQIARPTEDVPHGESPQSERPGSETQNIAQDSPDSSSTPPDSSPQSPQNAVPLNSPETKIVQEAPPGMRPGQSTPRRPQPTVPDRPAGMRPEERAVVIVNWSQIDGVAAAKQTQTSVWSGIESQPASQLWLSSQTSQLLTLSYSRVSGELSGGATVTADGDSLVEISARSADSENGESLDESALTPVLTVHRGRLAIEGLVVGQRLLVQVAGRLVNVEATQNNTTVAVERDAGATVLAAYRGEVRADDRRFTRRTWGRFDYSGEIAAFRPQRPADWYRPVRNAVVPPPEVCQAFNTATDVVQVAAQFETSADALTGMIVSQTVLNCSVDATQSISAAVASRLAGSANEAHRTSLIQWLISRFRENTVLGETDLRLICRMQQADQATTAAMLGWFDAAAKGQPPTNAQLSELMTGLRDTSPLFTRQCAKAFLQQILGDPLSEYSVSAPTSRAVLSSIASKVRAWQQSQQ